MIQIHAFILYLCFSPTIMLLLKDVAILVNKTQKTSQQLIVRDVCLHSTPKG